MNVANTIPTATIKIKQVQSTILVTYPTTPWMDSYQNTFLNLTYTRKAFYAHCEAIVNTVQYSYFDEWRKANGHFIPVLRAIVANDQEEGEHTNF